jgi:hypothetical protein
MLVSRLWQDASSYTLIDLLSLPNESNRYCSAYASSNMAGHASDGNRALAQKVLPHGSIS